jgi:hypothetical protein
MSLAKLLADIEPTYRDDVILGLICQPGTPITKVVSDTINHCCKKFPVIEACSTQGGKGWATGSCKLWRGTMLHFSKLFNANQITHDCIFTFDGNDGVPLHRNWIELLLNEHKLTRRKNKRVTGVLTVDNIDQPHINGNMILDLLLPTEMTVLLEQPTDDMLTKGAMWDVVNGKVFMEHSHPSSIIRNDWNQKGVTLKQMDEIAARSVWLHGYKDPGLRSMARERLLGPHASPHVNPSLLYYDKEVQQILNGTFTEQDWLSFKQASRNLP